MLVRSLLILSVLMSPACATGGASDRAPQDISAAPSIAREAAAIRAVVDHFRAKRDLHPAQVALDPRYMPKVWGAELTDESPPGRREPQSMDSSLLEAVTSSLPVQVNELDAVLDCENSQGRCVLQGVSTYLMVSNVGIAGSRGVVYVEQRTPAPATERTGTYLQGWRLTLEQAGEGWRVVDEFLDMQS